MKEDKGTTVGEKRMFLVKRIGWKRQSRRKKKKRKGNSSPSYKRSSATE